MELFSSPIPSSFFCTPLLEMEVGFSCSLGRAHCIKTNKQLCFPKECVTLRQDRGQQLNPLFTEHKQSMLCHQKPGIPFTALNQVSLLFLFWSVSFIDINQLKLVQEFALISPNTTLFLKEISLPGRHQKAWRYAGGCIICHFHCIHLIRMSWTNQYSLAFYQCLTRVYRAGYTDVCIYL